MTINLCTIDVLPAKCGIEVDYRRNDEFVEQVKFQAYETDPDLPSVRIRESRPTQWFDVKDCPIPIMWSQFRWED